MSITTLILGGFNTQPPEGGWVIALIKAGILLCFNTQPPEGGWLRWVFGCAA